MNPKIHMLRNNILTGELSPVGSITPDYLGQEYVLRDSSIWKAFGLTNQDWVKILKPEDVDVSHLATKESLVQFESVVNSNFENSNTEIAKLREDVSEELQEERSYTNSVKTSLEGEIDLVKQSVSSGKTLVANSITDMGVPTLATDSFSIMAQNIGSITTGKKIEVYKSTNSNSTRTFMYFNGSSYSAYYISCKPTFKPSMIIVVSETTNYGFGVMTSFKPGGVSSESIHPYFLFTSTNTYTTTLSTTCYSAKADANVFASDGTVYLPTANYPSTFNIICIE